MPNSVEGHDYIFEPAYLPILARCEELGYPLLFHPLDGEDNHYAGKERLAGPAFIYNTLGFPFETATTAAKFITTGLLAGFRSWRSYCPTPAGVFPTSPGASSTAYAKGRRTSS